MKNNYRIGGRALRARAPPILNVLDLLVLFWLSLGMFLTILGSPWGSVRQSNDVRKISDDILFKPDSEPFLRLSIFLGDRAGGRRWL